LDLSPIDLALRVKTEIETRLADPRPPTLCSSLRELSLDKIEVQGTAPHFDLVLLFRYSTRPGCLFGFRWKDLSGEAARDAEAREQMTGEPPTDADMVESFVKLFLINLNEEIEAEDLGLPEDCAHGSITWIR
jgi:hypothetical protein